MGIIFDSMYNRCERQSRVCVPRAVGITLFNTTLILIRILIIVGTQIVSWLSPCPCNSLDSHSHVTHDIHNRMSSRPNGTVQPTTTPPTCLYAVALSSQPEIPRLTGVPPPPWISDHSTEPFFANPIELNPASIGVVICTVPGVFISSPFCSIDSLTASAKNWDIVSDPTSATPTPPAMARIVGPRLRGGAMRTRGECGLNKWIVREHMRAVWLV